MRNLKTIVHSLSTAEKCVYTVIYIIIVFKRLKLW